MKLARNFEIYARVHLLEKKKKKNAITFWPIRYIYKLEKELVE